MKRFLEHRLKIRTLRAVDLIERQKSLLRAAESMNVTQPALTRTLQELEAIIGGQIFERHARGMRLTPFGEIVCTSARRILNEVERFDHDLDQFFAGETNVVSLGATPPAAIGILPDIYEILVGSKPEIHINLTQGRTEDLLPLLAAGEIEMVIGRLPTPESCPSFVSQVLYNEPISILARSGHPILMQAALSIADLQRYTYVLPTMSRQVEEEIDEVARALSLTIAFRASSLPFLREILHSSDHLTISPHFTMAGDLKRGTIHRVNLDLPVPPRPAGLLFRPDESMRPATRTLCSILQAYFRQSTP
ncbi:MAG TPA: LysR substrate-binding domain-containing protein [Xanthobacteraceae bacterium]|nr:LysR substrate-binding domain-containing protein [Xanthobacteraceae bacterium]